MKTIPETVLKAWDEHREGFCILTTATPEGIPNAIYVGIVGRCKDGFFIANNYFNKTKANLEANPHASLLFITEERKAYQLKGKISFHTEGSVYEAMKAINPDKYPGHSAALLTVESIYSGAEKLM
ncbi:MAG: pyridoxamine 5'-phosphate oxidase family protein [Verrucomicrobiota bacterium JB024]|nr:pyridoxamine 5'-phosphate oxidase family protein [Verrucomicrobiota bacterium JB024]